jgi:ParB family chromosome partitioning protein
VKADGAGATIALINPFRCRMWRLHDRSQEHVTEESCREEITSFSRTGQFVAALGRRLHDDPTHDIELIYGARRLFVARHLNVPIRVELRELSDREAVVAMDVENRQRLDISAYERGISYASWIREGVFQSQEDIANALKISASQVSRLIKVARLPAVILGAFQNPTQLCEGWALEIAAALEEPQRREQVIRKAREISRQPVKLTTREICRRLIAASTAGRKPSTPKHDQVVLADNGSPLFRIRHTRTAIMLLLPVEEVTSRVLNDIRSSLQCILQLQRGRAHKRPTDKPSGSASPGDTALPRARIEVSVGLEPLAET